MKSSLWLSAGLCVLCHCTGTETGNPAHREEALVAFAPLSAAVARSGLGNVSFERVAIRLAALSLEPCSGREPVQVFGVRVVDLFAGALEGARVPAGSYCAVVVDMGSDADSFAAGRMVSGGETSLTFESQLVARARLPLLEPLEISARASDGALRPSGAQASWIVAIDLAKWLDPIAAWLDSDDTLLTLNDPETMALRQAQARSLRLYEDSDGDGRLDPTEIERPLSEQGVLLR